jgi:hypothetical protein
LRQIKLLSEWGRLHIVDAPDRQTAGHQSSLYRIDRAKPGDARQRTGEPEHHIALLLHADAQAHRQPGHCVEHFPRCSASISATSMFFIHIFATTERFAALRSDPTAPRLSQPDTVLRRGFKSQTDP